MATSMDPRFGAALDCLAALEAESAIVYARQQQALVDLAALSTRIGSEHSSYEFLALDVAAACGIAQSTASVRLREARQLVQTLPRLHALALHGALHVGQLKAVLEATADTTAEVAAQVETALLPAILGMTSGDTRRLAAKTVLTLDAAASEERRARKTAERRAFTSNKGDGRAFLGLDGSAEQVGVAWESLSLLARLTYGNDDTRTLDQQRADLALALPGFALATRNGHGPSLRGYLGLPTEDTNEACTHAGRNALSATQSKRLQAVIVVPVQSALGMSDEASELIGYGAITAAHARDLLAAAELRQAACDVRTGRLLALSDTVVAPPVHVGRHWGSATYPQQHVELDLPAQRPASSHRRPPPPALTVQTAVTLEDALQAMIDAPLPIEDRVEHRHDPSPGLADLIRLRDTRCLGPGCSHPARSCDLEHRIPYPQGPTAASNLAPASRRCHNAKTYGGWTYDVHADGSVTWCSPTGTSYHRPSRTTAPDLTNLHAPTLRIPVHQRV